MRARVNPEIPTNHRVIEWNIARRTERLLRRSEQVILITGNMPDKIASGKTRYVDSPENVVAQGKAINEKIRGWIGDRTNGEITVALCSGSRGVDLEAYNTIIALRGERPDLKINVISILPLDRESFRQESVLGSRQEEHWDSLFSKLLVDRDAIVHEPYFRRIKPSDFLRKRKRIVDSEAVIERSKLLNGDENPYRIYSDTQQQLIKLTKMAVEADPQIDLRMLLVTDGGIANGPGGTNEMAARFFYEFGPAIKRRKEKGLETIHVVQEGLSIANGRRLETALEDDKAQNTEYRDSIEEAYRQTFAQEKQDSWRKLRRTIRTRRRLREREAKSSSFRN